MSSWFCFCLSTHRAHPYSGTWEPEWEMEMLIKRYGNGCYRRGCDERVGGRAADRLVIPGDSSGPGRRLFFLLNSRSLYRTFVTKLPPTSPFYFVWGTRVTSESARHAFPFLWRCLVDSHKKDSSVRPFTATIYWLLWSVHVSFFLSDFVREFIYELVDSRCLFFQSKLTIGFPLGNPIYLHFYYVYLLLASYVRFFSLSIFYSLSFILTTRVFGKCIIEIYWNGLSVPVPTSVRLLGTFYNGSLYRKC